MDYTCNFLRRAVAVDSDFIHKWLSPCCVSSVVRMDKSEIGCQKPSAFHFQQQSFQYLPAIFWDWGFANRMFAKFVSWWWLSLELETFRAWLRAAHPLQLSSPLCESQLHHSGSVFYDGKSLQREVERVPASGPAFKHPNQGSSCWH